LKDAKRFYEQSYKESRDISDPLLELKNLGDLAQIAKMEKDYASLSRFKKMYKVYKEVWPDMTYARVEGMILKHLGDLALGANPNSVQKAVEYYKRAFALLAKYETYRQYTVQAQMESLENHMYDLKVTDQVRSTIGQSLYNHFQTTELSVGHPEVLSFVVRWMEAGK
jgi:hypothetical protein